MKSSNYPDALMTALRNPGTYPHPVKQVRMLETHISWVFLAGRFAYKVKKPVNFGFLDFSELNRRQFFCEEELRLNRRLAPKLYLEVLAIGGTAEVPVFGTQPAIEYAVKMRRFAVEKTLDVLLDDGRLTPAIIDELAKTIADFHLGLPVADGDFGRAEQILAPAQENFRQLSTMAKADDYAELAELQCRCQAEFEYCQSIFELRPGQGMIRECHGDLHLGNIVLLRGKPTPFDGIEFNPKLRWIDVISDIGFLIMDLQHKGREDLAYRFLNAYLQSSGDYAGIQVLRFYMAYRSMVRAKVCALRATQGETAAWLECRSYLALTRQLFSVRRPALIITHGLPGCGKTTLSQLVLERFAAIRLRSDVERKRLFGLQASQNSQAHGLDIYTPQATENTYQHLLALSRLILHSGFPLIVDAAFLRQQERTLFRELARELAVPFIILSIHLDEAVASQRLLQRQRDNQEASEANVDVYRLLQNVCEPLAANEQDCALEVVNSGKLERLKDDHILWGNLERWLDNK